MATALRMRQKALVGLERVKAAVRGAQELATVTRLLAEVAEGPLQARLREARDSMRQWRAKRLRTSAVSQASFST